MNTSLDLYKQLIFMEYLVLLMDIEFACILFDELLMLFLLPFFDVQLY